MLLKQQWAFHPLEGLLRWIRILPIMDGASQLVFPTSLQLTLMLLIYGSHWIARYQAPLYISFVVTLYDTRKSKFIGFKRLDQDHPAGVFWSQVCLHRFCLLSLPTLYRNDFQKFLIQFQPGEHWTKSCNRDNQVRDGKVRTRAYAFWLPLSKCPLLEPSAKVMVYMVPVLCEDSRNTMYSLERYPSMLLQKLEP